MNDQTSNALGAALGSVGKNLGSVANYQAEQERFAIQQKILDRREQASMAFRAHLEELQMQNANEQHGLDRSQRSDEFSRSEAMNKDRMTIEQQRADTADKRVSQQLGLEQQRIGLEGQRIEATKENNGQIKKANAVGGQMKNLGATIQANRKLMQQEIQGAIKSGDWMMKSKGEQDATLSAIQSKYKPLISDAQKKYDVYAKAFNELTGVEDAGADYQQTGPTGTDLGGETDTPDTSTDSAEAAPTSGGEQASTVGNDQTPPRAGAKQAPDGKWYVPDPNRPGKWLLVNQ